MRDCLPTLHDPYNRRLRFKPTVSGDPFVRLLVFGFGLFGLDLVDLDAIFGVGEVGVHVEGVGGVDVFAFGRFGEDAVAGAGEGLEGAFEFGVVWGFISDGFTM